MFRRIMAAGHGTKGSSSLSVEEPKVPPLVYTWSPSGADLIHKPWAYRAAATGHIVAIPAEFNTVCCCLCEFHGGPASLFIFSFYGCNRSHMYVINMRAQKNTRQQLFYKFILECIRIYAFKKKVIIIKKSYNLFIIIVIVIIELWRK